MSTELWQRFQTPGAMRWIDTARLLINGPIARMTVIPSAPPYTLGQHGSGVCSPGVAPVQNTQRSP